MTKITFLSKKGHQRGAILQKFNQELSVKTKIKTHRIEVSLEKDNSNVHKEARYYRNKLNSIYLGQVLTQFFKQFSIA